MILIAPDKFKGTLSARDAASVIRDALPPGTPYLLAPMADGGEGTADILCASRPQWQRRDHCFVNTAEMVAVIDSSAVIGLDGRRDVMTRSSAPLGEAVRALIAEGFRKVVIGIGGTGTCDGGTGFREALGSDLGACRDILVGLSDVRVPLLGALMFAPQKGATDADIPILSERLRSVERLYGPARSPFDGAGGGLGFAIASVIGAPCFDGAAYVLDSYSIPWHDITMVITGEGRVDGQTATGKVVATVCRAAASRGIPSVAIGGCVDADVTPDLVGADRVIDTSIFFPDEPLTAATAARRLAAAAETIFR